MRSFSSFHISPMKCKPALRVHPLCDKLQMEMDRWCVDFASPESSDEEMRSFVAQKLPFLSCMLFPTVLNSRIPWLIKFVCWFTLFDSLVDDVKSLGANARDASAFVGKYLETIHGAKGAMAPVGGSLLSCFALLWQHFREDMPPRQYSRLVRHVLGLFQQSASQSRLRQEGAVLTASEFVAGKRMFSSGTTLVLLMEYGLGVELDEEVLEQSAIREIATTAIDHLICVNDILSFRVEYLSGDFSNLLSSICMSQGVGLQEAVDQTLELMEDCNRRFVELHGLISRSSYFSTAVEGYIDGLGYMMSGNLEWSWLTARYHGVDWVAPNLKMRQGVMYLEEPPRFEPTMPLETYISSSDSC
ncbi:hypothetical protein SELMODRAFT_441870 [Selaginella moellendorffii]|uniref:Terpene synthase n=1 Tax=Selaginella moellendorffii TaxID=88036 RepID=D8RNB1_SELML|nr:microbial Terpene synthase-like protein 13 [Selaginella moellendorffii]EFJ26468.1 hypothetical protein SELMODRAFT_441870 [Selaginella moellendorffii]|eukprot:XP_002972382.1 microbial Terpene synthase-like protein 13 [Selaginella moellendorffii]